jgi:hypothetical protein
MSKLETNTVDSISGTSTLTLGGSNASVVSAGTEVRSNKLSPASGTALQIGDSGDTITIPSGATIVNSGTQTGFGGVNTPAFSARLSSGLTLADNTATNVVFQTEFFDVGSCYNASNGIFTVPSNEGGKYCISTSCMFIDNNGNISDMALYIESAISGSTNSDEIARAEATSNGTLFTRANLSYTTVISLSAGDTIKIQAMADTNNGSSTALLHGSRNTVFSAFKIIE